MTRVLSALLTRDAVEHRTMVGSLTVGEVGHIPLHHWLELADGRRIDLRARLWLGDDSRVPHGIVNAGDVHASYVGQRSDLPCGPIAFWALTDTTMDAFGPATFLKGRPEQDASGTGIVAPLPARAPASAFQ